MKTNDEFRALPPEEARLPKEIAYRKSEENPSYLDTAKLKARRADQEKKSKQKRNMLIKLLAGTVASVGIIAGAAQPPKEPAPAVYSRYEFYTRIDAGILEGNPDAVSLTEENKPHAIGAIVSKEPVDLSEKLELEFDLLMTEEKNRATGDGSDGVSVAFSKYENVIIQYDGGRLGYDGVFGCEFDLKENPSFETPDGADYPNDHISVLGDSVWKAYTTHGPMDLDDGKYHHVSVTYFNYFLTIKFDGKTVAKSSIDNEYDELFLKICGTTGDGTCYQEISNVTINGEKVIIDDGYCDTKTDFGIIGEPDYSLPGVEDAGMNAETTNDTSFSDTDETEEETNSPENEDANGSNDNDESTSEDNGDEDVHESVVCSDCEGKGIICPGSIEADDPEGCHGNIYVDCKACNGTGKEANGRVCNWCKGTLRHMCPSFEFHYECPTCGGSGLEER